jgi:DNA invertase Pin-like site-specific DNA recombinase
MSVKAYAYLRVSGVDQIERDGFPRQREVCCRRAREYGCPLVCEYIDEAISGKREYDDRPALSDLLLDLANNPDIKLVFVEDARRFARDLIVQELAIEEFRKLGVTLIGAESNIDLTVADNDPTKKLIRQVLGAISEWDKSTTVIKLRKARQRIKRERGRCEGAKPFGTVPGEEGTLARIVELRRRGEDFESIAKVLLAEARPTRYGGTWTRGRVRDIYLRWLQTQEVQVA